MPFEGTADAIINMRIEQACDEAIEKTELEDAIEYTKAIMRKLDINLEKAMDILELDDNLKTKCLEYFKNNS